MVGVLAGRLFEFGVAVVNDRGKKVDMEGEEEGYEGMQKKGEGGSGGSR